MNIINWLSFINEDLTADSSLKAFFRAVGITESSSMPRKLKITAFLGTKKVFMTGDLFSIKSIMFTDSVIDVSYRNINSVIRSFRLELKDCSIIDSDSIRFIKIKTKAVFIDKDSRRVKADTFLFQNES